jgi:hypothetical protein
MLGGLSLCQLEAGVVLSSRVMAVQELLWSGISADLVLSLGIALDG